MNYVLFGVSIGNLGRNSPEGRPTSAELCQQWNEAFENERIPFKVRPAYRATGNFFLLSEQERNAQQVAETLRAVTKRTFAVFTDSDFLAWVSDLQAGLSRQPDPSPARRMTPGVVMDTNPDGGVPPVLDRTSRVVPGTFARARVRSVWKSDRLREDGKALDSSVSARDGGWGGIAAAMRLQHGGEWTARALSTLKGVAERMGPIMRQRAGSKRGAPPSDE